MYNFIARFFKKDNTKQLLKQETVSSVTITQANKQPFYHEIVGNIVRIYSRKDGFVEEVESDTPFTTALEYLTKYNRSV